MNSVRNTGVLGVSFQPFVWQVNFAVRERNWKPTVFAIPRRNFDREFCHMRFAANRLASHLESCNRANWSAIRAKFKSRRRTRRHASFQRGFGSKTFDEHVLAFFYFIYLFLFFLSFFPLLPAEFDTSFCLLERETRHAREFSGSRGFVSLFLTSIRVYFCRLLLFSRRLGCWWVKRKKRNSLGFVVHYANNCN